ncbi:SurA N-terminal domain-containing protein [Pseudodesulfovibrio sp.]|uniref:SurA N-terminal domain-containing protein n=1 Tax=unclassified Pseudodesulfovibrio TaxID=2661612 RepID=UPI003AFFF65B
MLDIMREHASGWVIKVLFAIIILAFVLTFGMGGLNNGQDPTLATVNDRIITRAEFEDAFQRTAEGLRRSNPNVTPAQLQAPQFKQMVLGELINSRLLMDEAERLGVSVSDEEVFAAISGLPSFKNQQGQFDRNIYQMALRSIRMTPSQFEANFKKEMIANKITGMVQTTGQATPAQARQIYNWVNERATMDYILVNPADFVNKIKVTDEQINDFYKKNEARFTVPAQVQLRYLSFTPKDLATYQKVSEKEIEDYYAAHKDDLIQKEEVKARHILIRSNKADSDADKKKAKEKIDEIYAKAIKPGANFAELAKKYSEGPSAPTGGELGWFGKGDMVPSFEKAAFETPKGQVTKPLETQFGWHIIYVEDRKEPKAKNLDEVKDEISRTIAEEKASEKTTDMLDQAMDRLVSGMKLDAVADELGLLAVTSRPVPETQLAQAFGLTPEAAKVIMKLPEGEAHSTPLTIDGGYMLVEKVKDIPSAPVPLEKVRDIIVKAVQQEQARELAAKQGEKVLADITAAKDGANPYAKEIKTSQPFGRRGNIPELGSNPNLATAVFQAKDNSWIAQPFNMPVGTLIVRKNTVIPAPEKTWDEQKDAWIAQANKNYEAETLNAFMVKLRKTAKIEINRPDLLN